MSGGDIITLDARRYDAARSRIAWDRAVDEGFELRDPLTGGVVTEIVRPRLYLISKMEAL